jgi:hypothetical protein
MPTSLPILSGIQSKTKVIKGPTTLSTNQYPINMPTNLNALIVPDGSASNQNDVTNLPSEPNATSTINNNGNSWVHCNEVPITFRPQLPSLPHASRNTKANLARQVTNVIKRHNGQLITDKII